MKLIKNSVIALAIGLIVISCGGGGSKQQQSGSASTETKAEKSVKAKGATEKAKNLLSKYGLSFDVLKPQDAFYANVTFTDEEVRFILPQGTQKNLKADFTKMIEAIKSASDDGKVYLYDSDNTSEFETALFVDNGSLMHKMQYIYKGVVYMVTLGYNSSLNSMIAGDQEQYPAYNITFATKQ